MKKIITVLVAIAHVIGYVFYIIGLYYLFLAKGFIGEYAMGFGIGLVYGSTILFISSLVALFFKKYYSDRAIKYFKRVVFVTIGVFMLMIILRLLS